MEIFSTLPEVPAPPPITVEDVQHDLNCTQARMTEICNRLGSDRQYDEFGWEAFNALTEREARLEKQLKTLKKRAR